MLRVLDKRSRSIMVGTDVQKKVKITTTRFGIIEVDEDTVIQFIDPVPGFPGAEKFVLILHKEDSPFYWLQSVELPEVAFVVTDPGLFFADYQVTISDEDLVRLMVAESASDSVIVVSIITIPPGDPRQMTANLMAPIVINTENKTAKQIVMLDSDYTTKHLLLPDS